MSSRLFRTLARNRFFSDHQPTLEPARACRMNSKSSKTTGDRTANKRAADGVAAFTEREAWRDVGAGWQPVFGSFRGVGYSIEWHDFFAKREFDWAASFHPGCVELCLNLDGRGFVEGRGAATEFTPNTAGFYHRGEEPLQAKRPAREQHRFLTVEFSCPFLSKHLAERGGDAASGGARRPSKVVRAGTCPVPRCGSRPASSRSSRRCGSRRFMPPRSRSGINARRWNSP